MGTTNTSTTPVSPTQRLVNIVWPYLGGKRGLVVLAIGVAAAGLALNWSWLVAIGIAPFLLVILPCAAMCGLGLCMNKAGGKSCSTGKKNSGEGTDIKGGPDREA